MTFAKYVIDPDERDGHAITDSFLSSAHPGEIDLNLLMWAGVNVFDLLANLKVCIFYEPSNDVALYDGTLASVQGVLLGDPIPATANPRWEYRQVWAGVGAFGEAGPARPPTVLPPPGEESESDGKSAPAFHGWALLSDPVTFPNVRTVGDGPIYHPIYVAWFVDTGDPATSRMIADTRENVSDGISVENLPQGQYTIHYSFGLNSAELPFAFFFGLGPGVHVGDNPSFYGHNINADYLLAGNVDWRTTPMRIVITDGRYGPRYRSYYPEFHQWVYASEYGLDQGYGWDWRHRFLSEIPPAAILAVTEPLQKRIWWNGVSIAGEPEGSAEPVNAYSSNPKFPNLGQYFEAKSALVGPVSHTGWGWNAILFVDTGDPATSRLLTVMSQGTIEPQVASSGDITWWYWPVGNDRYTDVATPGQIHGAPGPLRQIAADSPTNKLSVHFANQKSPQNDGYGFGWKVPYPLDAVAQRWMPNPADWT